MTGSGFPWLKWFPRDFASATRTWPLVARGVYRELLDAQWDLGGGEGGILPDDPEQLRELARASEAEWKVAWRFVAPKFPRVEGGRQNARLEEHRQVAVREFEGKRSGAAKTNAKRWARSSLSDSVSDSHSDSVSESLSDGKRAPRRVAERLAQRIASSSSSSTSEEPDACEGAEGTYRSLPPSASLTRAEGEADTLNGSHREPDESAPASASPAAGERAP